MKKINFSFVAIMKNERNTLPRLLDSLQPLFDRGVEFLIADTGSTDGSSEYARSRGVVVYEVGSMFMETITKDVAEEINNKFVAEGEENIVKADQKLFNFARARNYITMMATNDFVFTLDCDEAYSKFDIDTIIDLIESGVEQFEYEFVYAHDHYGRPAVQFMQSKAFNRKKAQWVGKVHEVVSHIDSNVNRMYLGEDIIKLEHYQEQGKEHRGNYLCGLAIDCFENPENDRNAHYLSRELMYTGRPKSAIKIFETHIQMGGWVAEKAQSLIFMGDCYGTLGNKDKQKECYYKAFSVDSSRREALIKLCFVYQNEANWIGVVAMAEASKKIPFNSYYANDKAMYEHIPHELLYQAYGWLGRVEEAKVELLKALEYQPMNQKYLYDTRFFFEYPSSMIDGWMSYTEELFLFGLGKHFNGGDIAEVGSWKGRSTNAILTGNSKGRVYCIDTWKGSDDSRDDTNWLAKKEDVFEVFKNNVSKFSNIIPVRMSSVNGAKQFQDKTLDAVFIDAGHRYEDVVEDIHSWLQKVKKGGVLCGHDYKSDVWMGVVKAVDDILGKPDEVHDTIWVKYIKD